MHGWCLVEVVPHLRGGNRKTGRVGDNREERRWKEWVPTGRRDGHSKNGVALMKSQKRGGYRESMQQHTI